MKDTKAKKSTYLRNFIIAVTLSAAILAAGALWVLLGWRSALDITLTDLAGDPAALRGFTMRGQSYFDTAHTYWDLHDGYLDTSFALDPDSVSYTHLHIHHQTKGGDTMRRNKKGKTVPQDLFVFLVLGLLAAVLAAVVHLLYHTEYAETSTPNDCFAAVSATATGAVSYTHLLWAST